MLIRGSIFSVFFSLLFVMSCTDSQYIIPSAEEERAGGESIDEEIEKTEIKFQSAVKEDSALSVISGSKIVDHMKGVSSFMDQAGKAGRVDKLPSRAISVSSQQKSQLDLFKIYNFRRKNYPIPVNRRSNQHILTQMSAMAIQLHLSKLQLMKMTPAVKETEISKP